MQGTSDGSYLARLYDDQVIISLEDLIRALEHGEMDLSVGQKMTRTVESVYADESVVQAVNRMARFGFGRFPVITRQGNLVGILTRGDILRGLLRKSEVGLPTQYQNFRD